MLYRILTVRKHKAVTFCDAYSFDNYKEQLAFYHDLVDCTQLVSGCTADLKCHLGKNKRGFDVRYVDEIYRVFAPNNSTSYKGFQKKELEHEPRISDLAQDLNGGIHLRQYRFRLMFLERLKALLRSKGLFETNTPITEANRGTSVAAPVQALGKYTGARFIKITHELGLKIQSYLALAPVYEVGYVMRDRYQTKSGLNEYLTLEGVIPCDVEFDLCEFYCELLQVSKELARELQLEYDSVFDSVEEIDVFQQYEAEHSAFSKETYLAFYEALLEKHPHCIVRNAPMDSPLGMTSKYGIVMESKWMLNGHGFGHGYADEYRPEQLRKAFTEQQNQLAQKGIQAHLPEEYLTICEYAGIPSFSFNFGIDRYLNRFFGEKFES